MNHKPTRPTVGPRGGRAVQATPCAECVSWRSCRPGACSEPFGCESWADDQGRRALPDELEAEGRPFAEDDATYELENPEPEPSPFNHDGPEDNSSRRRGGRVDIDGWRSYEPEPEPFRPAAPFVPDQLRGEAPAQSVLPMPDAGPLFAGCLEAKS